MEAKGKRSEISQTVILIKRIAFMRSTHTMKMTK